MLLLYRPAAGHDDMDAFQGELNVLEQWAERWGIIFNLDKWHVVKFGAQDLSNRIYFINGKAIGCVESFKYLGVTIANDFSWDLYIDEIAAKASQRLGFMKHVLFDAPRKVKRVAYLTLCRPLLKYACEVWDPFLVRQVKLMENAQRRAVRFIAGLKGRESSSEAREILGWEVLELRRKKL